MNRFRNKILAATVAFLLPFLAQSQLPPASDGDDPVTDLSAEPEIRIQTIIRSYGDSIVLRWAPDNAVAWSITNRFGYRIRRMYVNADSVYVSQILTPEPILPWSLERMMTFFGQMDTVAAVAAELIHGNALAPMAIGDEEDSFVDNLIRQSEMQKTRFAFAMQAADFSPNVATAMALRYTDRDVLPGIVYSYVIEALTPDSIVRIRNGAAITRCIKVEDLSAPAGLDIRQSDNNRIELAWARDENTAYFIERSTDAGKTFQRRNNKPYYSTAPDPEWRDHSETSQFYSTILEYYHIFSDSVTPGIKYLYRVQGIDAFADLTPYSQPIVIEPIDLTPLIIPRMLDAAKHNDTLIRVTWTLNDIDPDLAGFHIEKGPGHEGPWEMINTAMLDVETREYIDHGALETRGGYYRVVGVGHSGKRSQSFAVRGIIEDFAPPAIPSGLTGIVYFDGVVELFWDESPDDDLKGYLVVFANQADHDFTLITPRAITDNYFRDSIPIKTLTRKIYYKVQAEDHSGNRSDYSEVLELTRPDIIPPVTPLLVDARQEDGKIHIWWAPSPSTDVLGYRIFKKQEDQDPWQMVKTMEANEIDGRIYFSDVPAPSPVPWLYAIEAIDRSGNVSDISRSAMFTIRGKAVPQIPVSLQAQYDAQNGQVNLQWECDSPFPYYVILLKGQDEAPMVPVYTLLSTEKSWTDKGFVPGSKVYYSLRLQLEDGRQSADATPVMVEIPN